jgi:hypothetical protein
MTKKKPHYESRVFDGRIRDDYEEDTPARRHFIRGLSERHRAIGGRTQFASFRGGRLGATTSRLQYVVVEELVAIVDPRTRKVEIVFPR